VFLRYWIAYAAGWVVQAWGGGRQWGISTSQTPRFPRCCGRRSANSKAACQELVDSFVARINAEPIPATIYHYTDGAGLRGILESGSLRLGDIFYLNDPSDLRHGVQRALAVLDEAASANAARRELREFARVFRLMTVSGD